MPGNGRRSKNGSRLHPISHGRNKEVDETMMSEVLDFEKKVATSSEPDLEGICVKILSDGYCDAFLDFYVLSTSMANEDDSAGKKPSMLKSSGGAAMLKEGLIDVENNLRVGQYQKACDTYASLASKFESEDELKTGLFFREKALSVAQSCGDAALESAANTALGHALFKRSDSEGAIKYFERSLELAKMVSAELIVDTQRDLLGAYNAEAARYDDAGDYKKAVDYYQKSSKAARGCKDEVADSEANHCMGLSLAKLGSLDEAMARQIQYGDSCKSRKDVDGHMRACSALASVMRQKGDVSGAIENLEICSRLAREADNVRAEAQANGSLGELYFAKQNFALAVEYFEKYFEQSRSIGDANLSNHARCCLGIARGRQMSSVYESAILSDMDQLLMWRNRRLVPTFND